MLIDILVVSACLLIVAGVFGEIWRRVAERHERLKQHRHYIERRNVKRSDGEIE